MTYRGIEVKLFNFKRSKDEKKEESRISKTQEAETQKIETSTKPSKQSECDNEIIPLKVNYDYQYYLKLHKEEEDEALNTLCTPIKDYHEAVMNEGWRRIIPDNEYSDSEINEAKDKALKVYELYAGDIKKAKNSFLFSGLKVSDAGYCLPMSIITWVDTKIAIDKIKKKGIENFKIDCNDRDDCCKMHKDLDYSLKDETVVLPPFKVGCRCRILTTDGISPNASELENFKQRLDDNHAKKYAEVTKEQMFAHSIELVESDKCEYLSELFTADQLQKAKDITIKMYKDGHGIPFFVHDYTNDPIEQKLVITLMTHADVVDEIMCAADIYTRYPNQTARYTIRCPFDKCDYCQNNDKQMYEYNNPNAKYPPFCLGCTCKISTEPAKPE